MVISDQLFFMQYIKPWGGIMKKTKWGVARLAMVLALTLATLAIGTGAGNKQAMAQGNSNANLDGDRIVALGLKAGPSFYTDQNNTGLALFHNGKVYLIDCGMDTPDQFATLGVPFSQVAGIFFTHYHFDHTVGYADLLTRAYQMNKGPGLNLAEPNVYGPPGLIELTEGLLDAFHIGAELHNWAQPYVPVPLDYEPAPQYNEFTPNDPQDGIQPIDVLTNDPDMKVEAIEVDHDEAFGTCYAYRFTLLNDYEPTGKVVVFSGDRAHYNARRDGSSAFYAEGGPGYGKSPSDFLNDGLPNEDFQEAFNDFAMNATVLVHEASKRDYATLISDPNSPIPFLRALYWHLIDAHTDVSEIPMIAKDANVGTVVLHHYSEYTDKNLEAARSIILSGVLKANAKIGYKGKIIAPLEMDVIGF